MSKNQYIKKGKKGIERRKEKLSSVNLSTYVTKEEAQKIDDVIEELSLSRAEFIRMAIEKAIKSHERKKKRDAKKNVK